MRIFISGPYSAPTQEGQVKNVAAATLVAVRLIRIGHTPFCPHLSHWLDEQARVEGAPIDYERWMEMDLEWLAVCEALVSLGRSPGADQERTEAKRLGIPIYLSVEELLFDLENMRS